MFKSIALAVVAVTAMAPAWAQEAPAAAPQITAEEVATKFRNELQAARAKAQALRTKWLTKFQSVVPAGTTSRVIQIDRQLALIGQAKVASGISLVR